MNVHGVCHVWEGCALFLVGVMTYAWAAAYPFITGTTALLGLILAGHGVYRLVWRWWHGLPTFYDPREAHDVLPPNTPQ